MNAIKLTPVFKDYLWGGDNLKKFYNKQSKLDVVAESWELSIHPDGLCKMNEDATLLDYLNNNPSFLGKNHNNIDIMIKLIDAKDKLSVQVHPDNEYSRINENDSGKTEMWYILEANDDAFIYFGLKQNETRESIKKAIENNTITDKLNKISTHKGDVFFITPGTIHAIGAGNVIIEIQQSSNATYRLYDYARKDKQGNLRQLHIEKSLDVLNYEPCNNNIDNLLIRDNENINTILLKSCEYFKTYTNKLFSQANIQTTDETYKVLTIIDGTATLIDNNESLEIKKGETIFLPAINNNYLIKGNCEFVLVER